MSYYDLLMSDSKLQHEANLTLAQIDLNQYKCVTTKLASTFGLDSQQILAQLAIGDRLKIIQTQIRGKQKMDVFTASAKLVGEIPPPLVRKLTIKDLPDGYDASSFEDIRHYNSVSGFAVVRSISGGKRQKYSCEIDLYYQLQ